MKLLYTIVLCLLLFSCQNNNSSSNSNDTSNETTSSVQEKSPTIRFQHFVEQFPSVELPYTLNELNNFTRMDDEFIEHILGASNHPDLGLTQSAHCIATFKVGHNIAVIYQWMERPAPDNAANHFELAVFTPYGAQKGKILLGQEQNSKDDFHERLSCTISPDFQIRTEHSIEFFIESSDENGLAFDKYQSFYTNHYKIDAEGVVKATKVAPLWEKIPQQFTAPFLENYKKNPSESPHVDLVQNSKKTTLTDKSLGFSQVIIGKIPSAKGDSLIFVSSLDMEPVTQQKGDEDAFYINSKISLLQLKNKQLKIVTNQEIDSSAWPLIYQNIQTGCDCKPSPNVNEKGIVNLTLLGSAMYNGAYADFSEQGEIEFKCFNTKEEQHQTIYTIRVGKKHELRSEEEG